MVTLCSEVNSADSWSSYLASSLRLIKKKKDMSFCSEQHDTAETLISKGIQLFLSEWLKGEFTQKIKMLSLST